MVMVMPLAPPCMCQPETVSDHHHYDYDDHDDDCDEMLLALSPSYFCLRNITKTFSLFTNLFLSQALLPDNISSWHLTTSLVGNPNHLWTTLKMTMMNKHDENGDDAHSNICNPIKPPQSQHMMIMNMRMKMRILRE